jgi:hypothetical protein
MVLHKFHAYGAMFLPSRAGQMMVLQEPKTERMFGGNLDGCSEHRPTGSPIAILGRARSGARSEALQARLFCGGRYLASVSGQRLASGQRGAVLKDTKERTVFLTHPLLL